MPKSNYESRMAQWRARHGGLIHNDLIWCKICMVMLSIAFSKQIFTLMLTCFMELNSVEGIILPFILLMYDPQ